MSPPIHNRGDHAPESRRKSRRSRTAPLPTNRDKEIEAMKAKQKKLQDKAAKKNKKKQPETTAPATTSPPPAAAAPAPAPRRSATMSRILLADDSPQALRLGEQILSAQGFEVVSITDGAVAIRRLSDVNPDLFITDVYPPTKNGFELARFMKAEPGVPRYPDHFAAGPADTFDEQDARNAGADAILRKPFEASSSARHSADTHREARANPPPCTRQHRPTP